MTDPDIVLQPGQTVIARVSEGIEYRVHFTGWSLDVKATQNLVVRPQEPNSIGIGMDRPPDSEEG